MGITKRNLFFRIATTVLILIIIVFLSVAAYVTVWNSEEEHCWHTLSTSAHAISREIVIRMEDNGSVLQLAAGALLQGDSYSSPEDIIDHVNQYRNMTIFSRIDILYPDSTVLLEDGKTSDGSDLFSFDDIVAAGEHLSARTTDFITGRETVYFYVPVVDGSEAIAVLVGVIDCGGLANYFRPTIYEGKAACLLVDRNDGNIIMDTMLNELDNLYTLDELKNLEGYRNVNLFEGISNAESDFVAYTSPRFGSESFMFYTPIEGYNWQLLMIVEKDMAFEGLSSLRDSLTIVVLVECLIIVLFVALNLYYVNQVTKSKAEAERQLHKSGVLVECVTELSTGSDIDRSINNLLAIINGYFGGDRAYIFNLNYEDQTTNNLYEYAVEGVSKEIDNLQNVPISAVEAWLEEFDRSGIFYISDIDRDVNRDTNTYDILAAQGIHSLIAVPLLQGDTIIGYMGVDNPKSNYNDLTLLSSVQFFITEAMERKATHESLTHMSFTDTLTRLHNRNRFNHVCDEYTRYPRSRVGVAFFDLDGLKTMNDTYGHDAGDRLIVSAADSIRSLFSGNSYRVGGDEFAVIVPNIEQDEFDIQVDKVRRLMKKNDISVAIGVSWHEECLSIKRQLKEADERMYIEKAEHRRLAAEKKAAGGQ